jgi:hypothetical protein
MFQRNLYLGLCHAESVARNIWVDYKSAGISNVLEVSTAVAVLEWVYDEAEGDVLGSSPIDDYALRVNGTSRLFNIILGTAETWLTRGRGRDLVDNNYL